MSNKPLDKVVELIATRKSISMATVDKDGNPHASYASFVRRDQYVYVYTSSLSQHTTNLKETTRASIMFIEDEGRTANIFARNRFTCPCSVKEIPRDTHEWLAVMTEFESKFGESFGMIRQLGDFTLFRLRPEGGRYVRGFGDAHDVSADLDTSSHVTRKTHG